MEDPATVLTFEAFFEAEYDRLYRTLLVLTGDRAEADDLAQEAMARVYERWKLVRELGSPAGYVYTTAFNLHRRRLRRLRLWRERARHEPPRPSGMETIELQRDVRSALLRLPLPLREVLVLTEWLELSTEEAARVLNLEPVSVRGRVHRARRALRDLLGEPDE